MSGRRVQNIMCERTRVQDLNLAAAMGKARMAMSPVGELVVWRSFSAGWREMLKKWDGEALFRVVANGKRHILASFFDFLLISPVANSFSSPDVINPSTKCFSCYLSDGYRFFFLRYLVEALCSCCWRIGRFGQHFEVYFHLVQDWSVLDTKKILQHLGEKHSTTDDTSGGPFALFWFMLR